MNQEKRTMKNGFVQLVAIFGFSFFILPSSLLALCLGVSPASATPRLAVIQEAPDFNLIDHAGKSVRLAHWKGKVTLVSFIFTTCNGTCPATTHRMAKIHEELQRKQLFERGAHLVSITLDPTRDTPERLAGYMRLYDIDGANWSFLTGPPAVVTKTIAAWGMWARPAANGQLDHPSRVYLVDRRGRVREIYSLDFLRIPWVMEDIELLLREK
jgi:protein SCO1/2